MSPSVSFVENKGLFTEVKMYFDSEKDDTIAASPLVDFRFSKIFQIKNFLIILISLLNQDCCEKRNK